MLKSQWEQICHLEMSHSAFVLVNVFVSIQISVVNQSKSRKTGEGELMQAVHKSRTCLERSSAKPLRHAISIRDRTDKC